MHETLPFILFINKYNQIPNPLFLSNDNSNRCFVICEALQITKLSHESWWVMTSDFVWVVKNYLKCRKQIKAEVIYLPKHFSFHDKVGQSHVQC